MNEIKEEDLVNWITKLLRAEYSVTEDEHNFVPSFSKDLNLKLNSSKIQSIISTLQNKQEYNETTLFDGKLYENLIKKETRFGLPLLRFNPEDFTKEDLDNGINYSIK